MPKVKILLSSDHWSDDDYHTTILRQGLTDWEEITDEELKELKSGLFLVARKHFGNLTPIVVVQSEEPVLNTLAAIRAEWKRIDSERKKQQEEEARKREERKAKRKKPETEEETFKRLQAKFNAKG